MSETMEKAKGKANEMADKAEKTASNVKDKADSATGSVGSGMKTMGEKVEEYGPKEGMLGKATSKVSEGLKQSGEYLEEKGLSGMAGDVGEMIKRNPIPSLLLALGIGYLVGRALRS
jgi:hypothetical protein